MNKTRIAMLSTTAAGVKTATLRSASAMSGVRVDAEAGVIRNAAVATIGPAAGHGFELDKTSLTQLRDLINAEPDGVKVHFKHPEKDSKGDYRDQLGEMVGRVRNCRIEGASLRGDVELGEFSKCLPLLGNAWVYLLSVAEEDPTALGLSAVFAYSVVPNDDSAMPTALVARIGKVFQVDFVGDPAANPNGLLSANVEGDLTVASPVQSVLISFTNACVAAVVDLRILIDAAAAKAATPEGVGSVIAACVKAGVSSQGVTVAARAGIDAANLIAPGTMHDQSTNESASLAIRQSCRVRRECSNALEVIGFLQWGNSDLATAATMCTALLKTAIDTTFDAEDAIRPLTAPMVILAAARHADADMGLAADGTAESTEDPNTRSLGNLALCAARTGRNEISNHALAMLATLSPELASTVRSNISKIKKSKADDLLARNKPTMANLRGASNAGEKLLKYLESSGVGARRVGPIRVALFAAADVLNRVVDSDVKDAIRANIGMFTEAVQLAYAKALASEASRDPGHADGWHIAALSVDPNCEKSHQFFNGRETNLSVREALDASEKMEVAELPIPPACEILYL